MQHGCGQGSHRGCRGAEPWAGGRGADNGALYWILQTPDWITPDATTGHGEQSIITFTIASNFKNENTDMAARSGEIKISGGMTSVILTVNQLGYTAPVDPDASIGGITDMDEFKDFVAAVNNGRSLSRWYNEAGVARTVRPER